MLSFGNEVNVWSRKLFLKILANPEVSTIFLPSITLDTDLLAKTQEHYLKIEVNGVTLFGTCVSPRLISLEELKRCMREIKRLYSDKEVIVSLTYYKASSLPLIIEKIEDVLEEIDGLEINLIPPFYRFRREERELLLLKTAEALRVMERSQAFDVYVKVPFIGVQDRHIKSLADGEVKCIILSMHRIVLYKNSLYAVHSPYLARVLLDYVPLVFDLTKDYKNRLGISADFPAVEHVHELLNKYRVLQLDFNLLDKDIFAVSAEGVEEKRRPVSLRKREFKASIDFSKCNQCEDKLLCVKICPEEAIKLKGEDYPMVDYAKCSACGLCMAICPKNAVHWVRVISPE